MHKKRKVDRVEKRIGLGAAVQPTAFTDGSKCAQKALNLSADASAPVATTHEQPSPCEESASVAAEKSSKLERPPMRSLENVFVERLAGGGEELEGEGAIGLVDDREEAAAAG